jgi:pyridoxine kinase
MGKEVWPINTVQFSNHTGYGNWRGQVFEASHLFEVFEGIKELGMIGQCEAILSGYMGDRSIGRAILHAVNEIKYYNPKMIYCCDPVFGDYEHGIFVRTAIPEFFMQDLIPKAHIITPNQFEMEFISGYESINLENVRVACQKTHLMGPKIILITSFKITDRLNEINMILSYNDELWIVTTPYLPFSKLPSGCGDIFSALFLANYLDSSDPVLSLEKTVATIFDIISKTFENNSHELQLIQSQESITKPQNSFKAIKI